MRGKNRRECCKENDERQTADPYDKSLAPKEPPQDVRPRQVYLGGGF
jgi:hypothetical protein